MGIGVMTAVPSQVTSTTSIVTTSRVLSVEVSSLSAHVIRNEQLRVPEGGQRDSAAQTTLELREAQTSQAICCGFESHPLYTNGANNGR